MQQDKRNLRIVMLDKRRQAIQCPIHGTMFKRQDAAAAAKSLQLRPTLCKPINCSPPGSAVPGILQARILERVAISFSNAWKWKLKVKSLSCVWLFATPWTAAYQVPPSMGFSRQEYWSGLPLLSPKGRMIGSEIGFDSWREGPWTTEGNEETFWNDGSLYFGYIYFVVCILVILMINWTVRVCQNVSVYKTKNR